MRLIFLLVGFLIISCCFSKNKPQSFKIAKCDTIQLKRDLDSIIKTPEYRNYKNIQSLNKVAGYIKGEFQKISDSVVEQNFNVGENQYKNIICSLNTDKKERIVIGAHYDVCGDQDGADDNASGVAGLLELARLLKNEKLKYRIDFVAYTLEEPPFFGTENMGSSIHARYISENKIPLKGMICLEMIGYYNEKPHSQQYPIGVLKWFYGNKGDFITVVQKSGNGKFGKEVCNLMQKNELLATKSFKGPANLPGIDYSDHRNYWKYGYSAVMITNTSFYRNKNYHEKTDKVETLDIKRMALTIEELYQSVKQIK